MNESVWERLARAHPELTEYGLLTLTEQIADKLIRVLQDILSAEEMENDVRESRRTVALNEARAILKDLGE